MGPYCLQLMVTSVLRVLIGSSIIDSIFSDLIINAYAQDMLNRIVPNCALIRG